MASQDERTQDELLQAAEEAYRAEAASTQTEPTPEENPASEQILPVDDAAEPPVEETPGAPAKKEKMPKAMATQATVWGVTLGFTAGVIVGFATDRVPAFLVMGLLIGLVIGLLLDMRADKRKAADEAAPAAPDPAVEEEGERPDHG